MATCSGAINKASALDTFQFTAGIGLLATFFLWLDAKRVQIMLNSAAVQ